MLGIENLKKVLKLVCGLANVGDSIGADTSISRWSNLFKLIEPVSALGSIDWKQVTAEFKDLDSVERAALAAQLKQDFDIIDDNLEEVIESSVVIAEEFVSLFNKIKALKK